MRSASDFPVVSFTIQSAWRKWLAKNGAESGGVWLRLFKKDSGIASINHDQALDEALCFGWIDGQSNKYDEKSWLQKFTPRRARSMWSKRNIEHTERLIKLGKMTRGGLKEIERAKKDGRWAAAYDSAKNFIMPEDFLLELAKAKKAEAFFKTLNKTNTYAIAWRLQTAKKPETRARRMKLFLEMLAKGEKLY